MIADWLQRPVLLVDTETTGTDPEAARIVTAAAVCVDPSRPRGQRVVSRHTWMADPGVEIPAGATAVHGITTEVARAHGMPARQVVGELADIIRRAWDGVTKNVVVPVCGMKVDYDLTVVQRELVRHGLAELDVGPCLDVLVIDRACDRYRRGTRKLADLARLYLPEGFHLGDDAHGAEADAMAAGRVLYAQVSRYPVLRTMTLAEMQAWQVRAHAAWAANYQQHLRTRAKDPQPNAVIDGSWPWRPPAGAGEARVVCVLGREAAGGKP